MGSVHRFPQSTMDAAVAHIRAGESKAAIAAELGVHPTTVGTWVFDAEIAEHAERARAGMLAKRNEPKTGVHPAMLGEVMARGRVLNRR